MIKRKLTKIINIGGVKVGGQEPISVQSMTKTDTKDVDRTVRQIHVLTDTGCEIVRLALVDEEALEAFSEIKKRVKIPLVADIHFDYRIAMGALRAGADCIRINPGNIGTRDKIEKIVYEAKAREIPIRIGINSGSIEKDILKKYGHSTPEAMVASVLRHIEIMEELNFYSLKLSLKSSDVMDTVKAYRLISSKSDYPLHLGITEAGTTLSGTVKSSIGLGILLSEGIGDTIRVSLTAPPEEEVLVGYEILRSLGLRKKGIEIISCPTCGRCKVNLFSLVKEIKEKTNHLEKSLVVAIMGCIVNGPGEAREADLGIACGRGSGVIFRKGEIYKKIKEEEMAEVLLEEILSMAGE
ncbi:MAG TPA: flavodoxin-dependent (E)-4-hydroxy-3-methylbut-2-enyl-diphosphate synthase [Candidatus Eremiobacteraeota bacterium]|nr:MAG: 4-hydroxy-3-methylbut-2-en-1-yl diphosphate synthase [bacterium ADurb.Bin363]HPZ09573.1 flavodoxin-dependent (E)-4-hydroxy-3-methylbut-2-enyl-diphosphate synthase [Candidatus Eremiobacteraeota bacterium]